MSSSVGSLEKYRIPLEEIIRATNNFSSETMIGDGGFGSVHKGQLSQQWENRTVAIKRLNPDGYQGSKEFHNELAMVSSFDHQNIITFVGFCDDADQMIIVYHYASNGSLDHHLQDPEKRRCLTWEQRLKLCLGAARGLEYLHSGLGEHRRVIHRNIKSANILLDDNLDARICDFGLSRFGARNQENTQLLTRIAGTRFYMDPVYAERSRLTKESDVYSFGVVMFEISSGALVYHHRCFGSNTKRRYLIDLVRSYYDDEDKEEGGLDNLIDPFIRGHIDMKSFHKFNSIAHECLNLKLKQRPTMEQIIRNINQALDIQFVYQRCSPLRTRSLESFLIPLEEIKLATQGFNKEKCIGRTLVGDVYKGELHKRWQNPIAITRMYHQGENEFYNQVQMISCFYHQNILHFIGYCDEADERILVHEYAPNGSLGDLLEDSDSRCELTWLQYLEICIGAARGFQYLQLYLGEDNKVIHGRINSRNIMLNENLEAKISFFGFSNKGYLDPIPEKSDMYLFGLFLIEILNGKLFYREEKDIDSEALRDFVSQYHTCGLDESIDKSLANQIDDRCLKTIIDIAYECIVTDPSVAEILTDMEVLKKNPVARPSIDTVIDRLKYAAKCQASFSKRPTE